MNVELTRIADKKLEQMGATVHGVLAKNEVGRWVAVSEAGRVMWLDNFEGQSSSAQGEPSSGVPAGWTVWRDDDGYIRIDSPKDAHVCWKRDKNLADSHPLNMLADLGEAMLTAAPTPEAGQSGGEPVAEVIATGGLDKKWVNIHVMSADKLNMGDKLYTHPHTNQPGSKQGGEWVRCDERLPTEADGNLIWSHDQKRGSVELCSWAWSHSLFKHGYITHWQPTGLTRPQPPKSKEG